MVSFKILTLKWPDIICFFKLRVQENCKALELQMYGKSNQSVNFCALNLKAQIGIQISNVPL